MMTVRFYTIKDVAENNLSAPVAVVSVKANRLLDAWKEARETRPDLSECYILTEPETVAAPVPDAPSASAYWKLIAEYGRTPAQAQGIITSGARFCDACGKNYPIAAADILRDEYTRCCPLCTLTDIMRNGDGITQAQARAMLAAMDADAEGPERDDCGPVDDARTCSNCGEVHETMPDACITGVLLGLRIDSGDIDDDAARDLASKVDADALWNEIGPIADRLARGEYSIDETSEDDSPYPTS